MEEPQGRRPFWRSDNWVPWFIVGVTGVFVLLVLAGNCGSPETGDARNPAASIPPTSTPRPASTPAPSPDPVSAGLALIDELMECEPDKWDRDLLVLNLGEDKGYVAKLQTYLDLCEVVQTLPTSTPAPTVGPTASICSRPAEMAYLQAVTQGFGEQGEASLVVGDLFGEMDRDLGLLLDDDWRRAVAIQLGRLSATAADFLALSAPPSLREVDMNVKVIGKAMDEAVTLIAQGVDEFDADKLERATELFWGVLPYVTETPKAMEAICLK